MVMSEKPGSDPEDRFQGILDAVQDGLIVLAKNGVVRYLNTAAKETIKKLPEEVFNEEYPWYKNLEKAVEFVHPNPGSEPWVVQVQTVETQWDGEQVYLLTTRDISESKNREKLLRSAVDDAEARASELEIMRFMADQLNKAAMLEETVQAGLETVQTLSNAENAWVLLLEENDAIRMLVSERQYNQGNGKETFLNPPEDCTCLEKLRNNRLSAPQYIAECEWMQKVFPPEQAEKGHISLPLKTENKTLGVLNMIIPDAKNLKHGELKLLETLSKQLAVAIERASALTPANAALRRDQSLNLVTRTLSSALDLPTVLKNILQLAADMVAADAGALGIISGDGETLSFPFLLKVPEEMSRQRIPRGQGMFWEMLKNGNSILMDGYHGHSDGLPDSMASGLQSALIAPLISSDKTMGIISLFSMNPSKKFNRFDLNLVESLGRQAGLAIEKAELYFEVQMLTTSDSLTGLANQMSFNNLGMKEVERSFRYKRPLTAVLVDIDHLSSVNEKHGSTAGDTVIRSVGQECSQSLRRVDIACRYTNDEFALLLPETTLENGKDVAERIRQRVEKEHIKIKKHNLRVTVSVGIASPQDHEEIDLETLLVRAEEALTDAKQAGGNRVCTWKSED